MQPVLAITPGEPAGIGPEILLALHLERPDLRLLAVADPDLLRNRADALQLDVVIDPWTPDSAIRPGRIACHPVALDQPAIPGHLNPANAGYVLQALREATALVRGGSAAALVTGPVHKGVINEAGMPFSGHTEFLADLAGAEQVVMMLAAPSLRVALVTTHLALRQVADAITANKLESVIRITQQALREHFGVEQPRLQVLGLNPHAGEGGHLGREEGDVMYHDQGLPVLKYLGFGRAVNVTLGLPFIRTSVDHGTALDLAGTGEAEYGSLLAAAELAIEMALNRPGRR